MKYFAFVCSFSFRDDYKAFVTHSRWIIQTNLITCFSKSKRIYLAAFAFNNFPDNFPLELKLTFTQSFIDAHVIELFTTCSEASLSHPPETNVYVTLDRLICSNMKPEMICTKTDHFCSVENWNSSWNANVNRNRRRQSGDVLQSNLKERRTTQM